VFFPSQTNAGKKARFPQEAPKGASEVGAGIYRLPIPLTTIE
jgi:hypothetical protein